MAFGNKTGLEQNLSEDRRARSRRGSDRMNRLSGRSLALLALAVAVAGMGSPATALGATGSQTFTTAGENVFTVPPGVSSVQVQLIGGAGIQADGDALGGPGAIATATLRVVPGQTVFAEVGGGPQDTPLGPGSPPSTEAGPAAAPIPVLGEVPQMCVRARRIRATR